MSCFFMYVTVILLRERDKGFTEMYIMKILLYLVRLDKVPLSYGVSTYGSGLVRCFWAVPRSQCKNCSFVITCCKEMV